MNGPWWDFPYKEHWVSGQRHPDIVLDCEATREIFTSGRFRIFWQIDSDPLRDLVSEWFSAEIPDSCSPRIVTASDQRKGQTHFRMVFVNSKINHLVAIIGDWTGARMRVRVGGSALNSWRTLPPGAVVGSRWLLLRHTLVASTSRMETYTLPVSPPALANNQGERVRHLADGDMPWITGDAADLPTLGDEVGMSDPEPGAETDR